jgi:hypothetical protein
LDVSSVVFHICKLTKTRSKANIDNPPHYFKKLRTIAVHPQECRLLQENNTRFSIKSSILIGGFKKEGTFDIKNNAFRGISR